jgi:hypothetical protein
LRSEEHVEVPDEIWSGLRLLATFLSLPPPREADSTFPVFPTLSLSKG